MRGVDKGEVRDQESAGSGGDSRDDSIKSCGTRRLFHSTGRPLDLNYSRVRADSRAGTKSWHGTNGSSAKWLAFFLALNSQLSTLNASSSPIPTRRGTFFGSRNNAAGKRCSAKLIPVHLKKKLSLKKSRECLNWHQTGSAHRDNIGTTGEKSAS